MTKHELMDIKFKLGIVFALMLLSAALTLGLCLFVPYRYALIIFLPQFLALWFFKPTKIMEHLDYCWAVYRMEEVTKDYSSDNCN